MAKIFYRNDKNSDDGGNVFWVTLSDLMLGLAIVFITLFVLAMTGFSQENIQQQQTQVEIVTKVNEKLQEAGIPNIIDKMTGDLKLSDADLFDLNSWELSQNGKSLLDKIAPIYINTIFNDKEISDQIANIVIEGHTDSQMFAGVYSKDEQFMKNMDLSIKRANSVAQYILQTNYNKNNSDRFRKVLIVEGKSFNEPIIENGRENYDKSRRVVLKLKVRKWDVAEALGLKK